MTSYLAIAAYVVIGLILISTRPGLQGDEAFLLQGVVRILNGEDLVQFMASPYHGSAKTYLLLPLFFLTGIDVEWARGAALILGLCGLAGAVAFARGQFGDVGGALTAIVIAFHPGYALATVFDSTGLPLSFAIFGLLLFALDRLLRNQSWQAAFLAGLSIGLGGWTRANFVWPAAALAIAMILVRMPVMRHWRRLGFPLVAGGLLGGLPLILYQLQSGGGTLRYMARGSVSESPLALIGPRLETAWSVLFFDAHRRYIWGAASSPEIETMLCAALLFIAAFMNLFNLPAAGSPERVRTRRLLVIWLVLATLFMLTTRMPLGPHHFLSYLFLGVLGCVACASEIWRRSAGARTGIAVITMAYLVASTMWIGSAFTALKRNGGIDYWSDAIYDVVREVETRADGRPVKAADWGPGFNLRVLTEGRVAPVDLFWSMSPKVTSRDTTWEEEVAEGGIFIATHDDIPHDPVTSHAIRRAVEVSDRNITVITVRQRNGRGYAVIYDVPGPDGEL